MIFYEEINGRPDRERLEQIKALSRAVFGRIDDEKFDRRIDEANNLLIVTAVSGGSPVGFKIGYEISPGQFYSWLGGVAQDFRGRGIARELMRRQHEWCRKNGYRSIRTKTKNRFKEMLILNLKNNFDVTAVYPSKSGELKIVLEKELFGDA